LHLEILASVWQRLALAPADLGKAELTAERYLTIN
jgi:hypothetical protein